MTLDLVRAYTDAARVKGSVPAELADVVKEMKGILPYAGISLLDTIQLKVRDGLEIQDALPPAPWRRPEHCRSSTVSTSTFRSR